MPNQIIDDMTQTVEQIVAAESLDVRPECEWNFGRGPIQCGQPAVWAIVTCCQEHFVCAPCLTAVLARWALIELRCRACRVVADPASKIIRRVVLL